MIKVYCDICGECMGEYEIKAGLPEDQPTEFGHQVHECECCKDVWKNINVEDVLKRYVRNQMHG